MWNQPAQAFPKSKLEFLACPEIVICQIALHPPVASFALQLKWHFSLSKMQHASQLVAIVKFLCDFFNGQEQQKRRLDPPRVNAGTTEPALLLL